MSRKKLHNQIRLFTIIGVLIAIIGYSFLFYQGYELNKEISEKKDEIGVLEERKVNLTNNLKELEAKALAITLSSSDTNTVKQGKQLALERGIPTGKHFTVTPKEESNLENAKKFEELGFQNLLDKDISASINAFIRSENSMNGYNSVYEIAKYLNKNRSKLNDTNSDHWQMVYQDIISEFSWRMPENFKNEFLKRLN